MDNLDHAGLGGPETDAPKEEKCLMGCQGTPINVPDGFLKPWHNTFYCGDGLLGEKAVHFIAQANVDSTVLKPTNPYMLISLS